LALRPPSKQRSKQKTPPRRANIGGDFHFGFFPGFSPFFSCSWPLSYLVVSQSERQEDRQPVTGFPIHLLEQTLWDRAWFIFPCCSRSSLGARRICQVFLDDLAHTWVFSRLVLFVDCAICFLLFCIFIIHVLVYLPVPAKKIKKNCEKYTQQLRHSLVLILWTIRIPGENHLHIFSLFLGIVWIIRYVRICGFLVCFISRKQLDGTHMARLLHS